jgi:CBS domain-containing protein
VKEPAVRDVMTTLVVTFRPDETIYEAAQKMLSNRISGGPVVVRGKVLGVLSESDIARALVPRERLDNRTAPVITSMFLFRSGTDGPSPSDVLVRDVMSSGVIAIGPNDGLWTAARMIEHMGIKRLPVVDEDGSLVGIVARADIVRATVDIPSKLAG